MHASLPREVQSNVEGPAVIAGGRGLAAIILGVSAD
jgi:hypothetical protein